MRYSFNCTSNLESYFIHNHFNFFFLKDSLKGLSQTAGEVTIGLASIFQAFLYHANIPDKFRKAIVTPIIKGGNKGRSKAENYRINQP